MRTTKAYGQPINLTIPALPLDMPEYAPLRAIRDEIARLKGEEKRVMAALATLPTRVRQAEAERTSLYSENIRAGKKNPDPGDGEMVRLDREKDDLSRQRRALRGAINAAEQDFLDHIESHGPVMKAAAAKAEAAARASARDALDAAEVAWGEADLYKKARNLAAGARSPAGLPVMFEGKRSVASVFAALRRMVEDRAAELTPAPAAEPVSAPTAHIYEGWDPDAKTDAA